MQPEAIAPLDNNFIEPVKVTVHDPE